MPLTLAAIGEENIVCRIGGDGDTRSHLAELGIVCGATVSVISARGGDLIVSVNDTTVAVSRELAEKIIIQ